MITEALLVILAPQNKNVRQLVEPLNRILPKYEIATPKRIAAFLAQVAHESGGFTALIENLNYSADALRRTWPKRFDAKTAQLYARKPEKIANRVYSSRMGNGDEASGDGWRYRGRGLIQTTGKENYAKLAQHIGKDLATTVVYCETLDGAVESACFYWKTNDLNDLADSGDFVSITKRINGGTIGLTDRLEKYKKALKALGEKNV